MSLTTSLSRKDHVYRAIVAEAPGLTSPALAETLNFAGLGKEPDLTTVKLSSVEAALVGTAFDYLQRFLIGEKWRREPRWDPRHVSRLPLLPLLHPWALTYEDLEIAAITMALLDQVSRVGVGKVMKSPIHGPMVRAKTLEAFAGALSSNVIQALRELREVNSDIIEQYRSRTILVPGPHVFASSLAHGADPDAIYGSSLVEVKAHRRLSPSNLTSALTQAMAYALLDTLDEYKLDTIEVWAAKQALVISVPISDLVLDPVESRRRLALKLRWSQYARDDEHAQDLIARGNARIEQIHGTKLE